MHRCYLAVEVHIFTTRLLDQHFWLYLYFYKSYNKPALQNNRPVCTAYTLQVTMTSRQLTLMADLNGFVSPSLSRLISKLGRIVDQHSLVLAGNLSISRSLDNHLWFYLYFYQPYNKLFYQDVKPASTILTLQVMITSPLLS